MVLLFLLGCLTSKRKDQLINFAERVSDSQIKNPSHLEMFTHRSFHHHLQLLENTNAKYLRVAQKYDGTIKEEISAVEYFAVRSTFHHMTAVGDILFPEASLIVKKLLYVNRPKPTKVKRNIYSCRSYRKPYAKDDVVVIPSNYFRKAKKLNQRIRAKGVGVHVDSYDEESVEPRVAFAYNPSCYDVKRLPNGKKHVRMYMWMNWSRESDVPTPLLIWKGYRFGFPDCLIHVAGTTVPYYAMSEWVLP